MTFVSSVHAPAIALRQCVIAMTTVAGSGHPTAAVRLAPLPTLRRYPPLRDAPASPPHPARARLVFSEGHACPSVYAAAAALGLTIGQDQALWRPMMRADARRLQAIDSAIDGPPHPAAGGPCFPAAPSSLGQGLARASCLDGGAKRLFCLLGAGASRAGQSWDAVDCLGDDRLQTVCPLFTWHGYGPSGLVRPQHASAGTAAKLWATGLAVQLLDGHTPAWTTICTPDGTPLLSLLQPAEAYAAYALTGAMAEYDGSYYLRTVRPDGPFLYSDATPFPLGGHHVLSQGHTLCRAAAGDRVQEPPQALGLFQGQGLVATRVALYALPVDEGAILGQGQDKQGQVLTVEDHDGAGIGAAMAEWWATCPGADTLAQLHVRRSPTSGRTPAAVLRAVQRSATDIAQTAVTMLDVATPSPERH